MIRQLLMVSDDGKPDFEISSGDNLLNWLKDDNIGTYTIICIVIGVLIGLFIAYMIHICKSETFTICCDKCEKDLSQKWHYCPYCGDPIIKQNEENSNLTKNE